VLRCETVCTAFERFSCKDFVGVLALCHPDVQMVDPLRPGVIIRGKEAIRHHWESRYDQATMVATIGEHIVETDDTVIVVVRFRAYDESQRALVPPFFVAFRLTFRDDLIVRCEGRIANSVPPKMKALLHLHGDESEV